jgi:hypothetical protein
LISGQTKSVYITEHSIPKPYPSNIKISENIDEKLKGILELVEEFKVEKFFKLAKMNFSKESTDSAATDDVSYTGYIAENKRHECPKLLIEIVNQEIFALIDTGCELSIMNEHLYNRLRHEGLKCLELPTQHVNLLSAFNKKSNRIKRQAMMDIKIGDVNINQIVLLSPQLLIDAILGLDFLVEYGAVINFEEHSITLKINGECTKYKFIGIKETTDELDSGGESSEDLFRNFGLVSVYPRKQQDLTADRGQHHTDPSITTKGNALVEDEREEAINNECQQQRIEDEVNMLVPRRVCNRDDYEDFTSKYDDGCRNVQRNELVTLAKDKEGHIVDKCSAIGHQINEENKENMTNAVNRKTLCLTTTSSKTNAIGEHQRQHRRDTRQIKTDDRMMTAEQLRGKVGENNNLSTQQREELYIVLAKYQRHVMKRPGKCHQFEYEFKIEGSVPTSTNSRPIPLALRDQVREQIQIMLQDDILEESLSSYINPLTLVVR